MPFDNLEKSFFVTIDLWQYLCNNLIDKFDQDEISLLYQINRFVNLIETKNFYLIIEEFQNH